VIEFKLKKKKKGRERKRKEQLVDSDGGDVKGK
jgi:hypothetical protein